MSQYTIFLDVSGLPCKKIRGQEFLTCAGIAIETPEVRATRELIPLGLPKWRKACARDIAFVAEFVNRYAISALALRVKKQEPLWSLNWSDAEDYCQMLASKVRRRVGFAKAAQFTRYMLFVECAGRLTLECLRASGAPRILDSKGCGVVDLSVVCDSDIQGQDNLKAFNLIWKVLTSNPQNLLAKAGLTISVRDVVLATEEKEPLLLLPDYLAGVFQAGSDPMTTPPTHCEAEVRAAAETLRSSGRAVFVEKAFDISYRQIYGKRAIGRKLWGTPNTETSTGRLSSARPSKAISNSIRRQNSE